MFERALMIERVWSARTTRDGGWRTLRTSSAWWLPELAAVAGYRGARLLPREIPGGAMTEVVVVTRWESVAAVAAEKSLGVRL